MNEIKTDFLFSTPTFLGGIASVLDISGNLEGFNSSASGEVADAKAINNDWKMVGKDLSEAIEKGIPQNEQSK